MNLYHSTMKGLRECDQARRRRLQLQCFPVAHHEKQNRRLSLLARVLDFLRGHHSCDQAPRAVHGKRI